MIVSRCRSILLRFRQKYVRLEPKWIPCFFLLDRSLFMRYHAVYQVSKVTIFAATHRANTDPWSAEREAPDAQGWRYDGP